MDKRGAIRLERKTLAVILVLIVVLIGIYFLAFHEKKCSDKACFEERIAKCKRTSFINEKSDMVLKYNVIGKIGGKCRTDVLVLEVKKGTSDVVVLNGKKMSCLTPIGVISYPEEDISKCSGKLKEDVQTLIINRMYTYVLENMGKINDELDKVI
ncbi:hypothetical protein COV15_01115 [Candidatus Woesearchaeota archaeon CG10_big_fil_rev_8_21_14_0_10_34_12]|nr:MAG: hypothetical protein COV15_01115 [Candidatus Woesearchaeota archaeon CG10_big_fil_rev_8_21_14_0_10_34_12]